MATRARKRSESADRPIQRLTHSARRIRRKKMADAVKAGAALDTIARRFGVGIATVRGACAENRVPLPDGRGRRKAT